MFANNIDIIFVRCQVKYLLIRVSKREFQILYLNFVRICQTRMVLYENNGEGVRSYDRNIEGPV